MTRTSEPSLRSSIHSIGSSGGNNNKPLPLKQRTSSIDTRKDISIQTWWSLRELIKLREYFITVDNFSIWKRHLSWALTDGGDLRAYLTQRFSSSMVFMSLILGAELQVLFNSAVITTDIRHALTEQRHSDLRFWIGIVVITSVALTLFSLISTFTAWGMVSAVSDSNAHCILRSSIGQYVVELPGRLIVFSIYAFLLWVILFIINLLPTIWSIFIVSMVFCGFVHIMIVFSAFGRIIMHTGAMGSERIFSEKYEQRLLPRSLQSNLILRAKAELANNTSITRQYRRRSMPIDREFLSSDDMSERLNSTSNSNNTPLQQGPPSPVRRRTESQVRFADELWNSIPAQHHQQNTNTVPSHHRSNNNNNNNNSSGRNSSSILSSTYIVESGGTTSDNRNNGSLRPSTITTTSSRPLGPPKRGSSTSKNSASTSRRKNNKRFLGHAESSASLDEWLNGGGAMNTTTTSESSLSRKMEGNWATDDIPPRITRSVLSRGRSASEDQILGTSTSLRSSNRASIGLPNPIVPPKSVGAHTRILSNVSSIAATEDCIETELDRENENEEDETTMLRVKDSEDQYRKGSRSSRAQQEVRQDEMFRREQEFGDSLDDLFDPESSSTVSGRAVLEPALSSSFDGQQQERQEGYRVTKTSSSTTTDDDDDDDDDNDLEAAIRSEHQSLLNPSNIRDSIRPGYNSTGMSLLYNKNNAGGGGGDASRKR